MANRSSRNFVAAFGRVDGVRDSAAVHSQNHTDSCMELVSTYGNCCVGVEQNIGEGAGFSSGTTANVYTVCGDCV